MDALISKLQEGRKEFLTLIAEVRPDLHRYCARMTGSVIDGEDIVQETLARAYYALPALIPVPPLRPWLFRIAHNCAADYLRRAEHRRNEPLNDEGPPPDDSQTAEEQLLRDEATRAALARFLELPAAQRSAVVLKDVLGNSLEEIAEASGTTVAAVKASLHRGRTRLKQLATKPATPSASSPELARYAALFNARDFDAVRALLADEVKLDLVSHTQRTGVRVGEYFTNYEKAQGWRFVPGWLDGREVLAIVYAPQVRPTTFVELEFSDGKVRRIRDFRFVLYLANEAVFTER